jgi:hypothetical protein
MNVYIVYEVRNYNGEDYNHVHSIWASKSEVTEYLRKNGFVCNRTTKIFTPKGKGGTKTGLGRYFIEEEPVVQLGKP